MKVVMTFDDREWQSLVKTWQAPIVRKVLENGARAFGETATPIVQSATPSAKPGNKYAGSAGNLKRRTRWARFAPTYGVGVVVGAMGKESYYRRWVTGGTLPHSLKKRGTSAYAAGTRGRSVVLDGTVVGIHDHPGSNPNDYIGRIASRATREGFDAADKVILDGLEGIGLNPPR